MNFDEILTLLTESLYIQSLTLILGVTSGIIAIHQLFFKTDKIVEIEKKSDVKINHNAKGLCADCNSFISSKSSVCPKCGSSAPFDLNSLKDILKKNLDSNFHMVERYLSNREDINGTIKIYNYLFIPCLLFIGVVFVAAKEVDIEFVSIVGSLISFGIIVFLIGGPHVIINEYTNYFNLERCSSRNLLSLDEKVLSIINSLQHDKESLIAIKKEITERIDDIDSYYKLKSNNKMVMTIYFSLQFLFLLIILNNLEYGFKSISSDNLFEDIFTLSMLLGAAYISILAIFRLYWIHFIYLSSSVSSGKRHLKNQLYSLNRKLGLE